LIFVDTSVWFAYFVEEDVDHALVRAWHSQMTDVLVTTDYVLDELLTLLKARGYARKAARVGDLIFAESMCELLYLNVEDVEEAWRLFRRFDDKAWSFTDCTSYIVMQRLGITTAAALDDHFRQFGFVSVVPDSPDDRR
jgi:uncharacterized protein